MESNAIQALQLGCSLQKFWISFAESNVMMTLERHFGWPDAVKLTLEPHLEQPGGAKLALERRFGSPGGVKLALERRLGRLEWRFSSPGDVNMLLERDARKRGHLAMMISTTRSLGK